MATDLHRSSRIKNKIRDWWRMRMVARVSAGVRSESTDLLKWAAGMSTGLAQEMQNQSRVPSCESRVVSGRVEEVWDETLLASF